MRPSERGFDPLCKADCMGRNQQLDHNTVAVQMDLTKITGKGHMTMILNAERVPR